jgi:hypothetical protein
VVAGRGQFVCGARGCDQRVGLASFEAQKKQRQKEEKRAAKKRRSEDGTSRKSAERKRAKSDRGGCAGGSGSGGAAFDAEPQPRLSSGAPQPAAHGAEAGASASPELEQPRIPAAAPVSPHSAGTGRQLAADGGTLGGVESEVEAFFKGLFE